MQLGKSNSFLTFIHSHTKELFATLALYLLSSALLARPTKAIASVSIPKMKIIPPSECFSEKELQTLAVCYDEDEPKGKILAARHGNTHYRVYGTQNGPSAKGLVVLSHGIGVSHHAFEEFAQSLVESGYSVLSYDYFGHGYSKYVGDMFFDYDIDMFVDQLEDVLSFVEKDVGETCVAICGHSTGGLVCAAANKRWLESGSRSSIPKVILCASAMYAKKPFMARVADKIPKQLTFIMKNFAPSRVIIGDSYIEAGEIAFGRDPSSNKVIFAEQEQKKADIDNILFGKVKGKDRHPYLEGGILSINCHTLRGDLLEGHRDIFVKMLELSSDKSKTYMLWGNLDRTVPYLENVDEVKKWESKFDNFHISVLDRHGHEMFYEDSKKIAEIVVKILDE